MPTLKLLKGQSTRREFRVEAEEILLGREDRCDIQLMDEQVSRQHARIVKDGEAYYLLDLGSRNFTYLNGKRLEPNVRFPLQNNDLITIFRYVFSFVQFTSDTWQGRLPTTPNVEMVDREPVSLDSKTLVDSSSGSWQFRTAANTEAKLRAMIQITRDLHTALALERVLARVLESLLKIFVQAESAVAVLIDTDTKETVTKAVLHRQEDNSTVFLSRTVVDHVMTTRKAIIFDDVKHDPALPLSQSIAAAERRSIMCAPLLDLEERPLGVMQLDSTSRRSRFTNEDLDLFSSVALQVSLAVEDSKLHEIALRDRELQRELEVAREIQLGLLPSTVPEVTGYDFYDFYAPAKQVGGDYYDYLPLSDGRLAIVLGDVAGKGVSAALLMAKLSSEMRVHLAAGLSPIEICARVNSSYCDRTPHWRFVTAVLMILDSTSNEIDIVNAGHMRPLLRRADGTVSEVGDKESGLPLGVATDYEYQSCRLPFAPGDLLVVYSDGVSDAMNGDGARFGVEGLRDRLAGAADSASEFGGRVIDELQSFVGNFPQTDDICLLGVSRDGT